MLTTDLLRTRVSGGVVRPTYTVPHGKRFLNLASPLVELFERCVGSSQGELDEALADLLSEGGDLKLRKGLAKLLRDRCTFEPQVSVDPVELRREVFLAAGKAPPLADDGEARAKLVADLAAAQGLSPEELEAGLYADLKDAHRFTAFEAIEPEDLLHRYNVALAQAVLYRASEVRIELVGLSARRYRQLFRWVKFFQLSFRAEPLPTGGYKLTLDGPLSIFRLVQRYGFDLARFLPALLLADGWTLEADVTWDKRRQVRFALSPEDGLRSHYRDTGVWTPEEQRWFVERFESQHKKGWRLEETETVLSLGGRDVLVPDYTVRHEDGREALLEIVWSYGREGLARHVEMLKKHGPANLILAVCDKRRLSEDELAELPDWVVRFKQALRPASVAKVAAAVATAR